MKTFALIILSCCCKFSFAQFSGGSGSGEGINTVLSVSLTTPNTKWSGGNGDGFQAIGVSSVPLNAQGQYSGGQGDGFQMSTALSLPVTSISNGYSGGIGAGFKLNTALAVPILAGSNGYSGGQGDGFQMSTALALPVTSISNGYSGGIGAGFKMNTALAVPILAGSNGYSGGKDDGFSSQDAIRSYIFVGTGNWDIPANWMYNTIPPMVLPANSRIQINPTGNTECILNVPQNILSGATITIMTGKRFRIIGDLILQ